MPKQVIAVVGPTASGKSRLAHQLAKILNSEVISADSRLVYKGLDIGTAKPSPSEMAELPYHMVNVVTPDCDYSLGKYLEEAKPILERLLERGLVPVVVGGTGFYFRGLLENLSLPEVKPDFQFRESLTGVSTDQLYSYLKTNDHEDRWKMHPNDRPRIIRALELTKAGILDGTPGEGTGFEYQVLWLGLNCAKREKLRARIAERTEQMLQMGLIEETQNLLSTYGHLELFERTIGYKETIEYLQGSISSLPMLSERISQASAQYAKRQLTWFRRNESINWLNSEDNLEHLIDFSLSKLHKSLPEAL